MSFCTIADFYYAVDASAPEAGATVVVEPGYHPILYNSGSGWQQLDSAAKRIVTDATGYWSISLPQGGSCDPATSLWTIRFLDGTKWAGIVPNIPGPVNIETLKTTYAWSLVTTPQAPVLALGANIATTVGAGIVEVDNNMGGLPVAITTASKGAASGVASLDSGSHVPLTQLSGLTDVTVAAANKDGLAGTASLRTLGTGAQQAAAGNDTRLSDARAPTGTAGGDLTGAYPNPTIAGGAVTDAKVAAGITASKLSGALTGATIAGSAITGSHGIPDAALSANVPLLNVDDTFTGKLTATALTASGLTGATAASRYVGATASGAPVTGSFLVGDFVIDQSGHIWVCTGAGTPGTWASVGNAGTVTSVGMSVPSILSVSGSPITGAGTLAVTLANESANQVFAGPTSGLATTPTFRALVAGDIPAVNPSALTGSGTVPLAALSGITTSQLSGTAGITSGQIASVAASSITGSHSLPDGVLSSNVPLLNAASATNNFTNPPEVGGFIISEVKVAEVVLGGTQATIDFASIPSTFRSLRLVIVGRGSASNGADVLQVTLNADSGANYNNMVTQLVNGVTTENETQGAAFGNAGKITDAGGVAGMPGVSEISIPSYAGTTFNKVGFARAFSRNGAAIGNQINSITSFSWASTAAINEITLALAAGSFVTGTVATLYGLY